jgi:hypothetical protein
LLVILIRTKQLRVYNPELGYTFRSSKVLVDEKVKGGSINLQLRNCTSGPQETLNSMPDRKPRGRPRTGINEISPLAPVSPVLTLPNVQSTSEVVTPIFIPVPDIPQVTQNNTNDHITKMQGGPGVSCWSSGAPLNSMVCLTNSGILPDTP